MKPFDSVERGSHVFVIYYSKELELYDFHSFLKNGIENNELVIIFLENCPKDKIYALSKSINLTNYENHKKEGNILIKPTEEWFHPDECLNAEIFIKKWEILVANAIKNGKEGIRIFVETNKFLREKLDNALIIYDKILEDLFDFPITSMYIYKNKDIESMTTQQIAILNSNRGYHLNELVV
ncbi:MAG: MEDS domain-containing protein [Candidatus Nitrosocosmicus sp.]|nr:MEDS domain-containing protein [Candidatus Nitrosocosmicus sp.]MDN5866842.1 MEDS domain-containing protein [Candidatus Nitrosocosmicus sp.]